MIRLLLTLLPVLGAIPITANATAGGNAEDPKLNAFFKEYLEEEFRQRPLEATRLGDHRFDSQLEELTPEARAKWLELTRKTLANLPQQVDYQKLSRPAQIDFETFQHNLKADEWLTENTHPYEQDPRVYNGYINDSVYLLLAQSSLPRETNVANCIARMALLPKVVTAAKQNLRSPCLRKGAGPRTRALRQSRGFELAAGGAHWGRSSWPPGRSPCRRRCPRPRLTCSSSIPSRVGRRGRRRLPGCSRRTPRRKHGSLAWSRSPRSCSQPERGTRARSWPTAGSW